eukprot:SAG11_NODE_646_length_7961_cov_2.885907_2_plen_157_part_00
MWTPFERLASWIVGIAIFQKKILVGGNGLSVSVTPEYIFEQDDISTDGDQPGMVMALRLSHLEPAVMGVTWATPNRSLALNPKYRAIVRWGLSPDALAFNSTASAIDLNKAEVGAVHRCNGVNPAPATAVQGPWMHYLAMNGTFAPLERTGWTLPS